MIAPKDANEQSADPEKSDKADNVPTVAEFKERGFRSPRKISEVTPERSQADRQVIGSLVQRGEVTNASSHPKVGKTTWMRNAIGMMEHGQENPWGKDLGSIVKGKVLILSEEPDSIWDEWREALSLQDHVSILNLRDLTGGTWLEMCSYAAALVREDNFDLVVVDTLSVFASIQNENDNSEMTTVMTTARIISDSDAGVLLVHHLRKAKAGGGLQTRGGSAINAGCDTPIEMRTVKDHPRRRRFQTYSRHGYIPRIFTLELEDGQYRRVDGPSDGPTACENRQKIIVGLLPDVPPGLDWPEILELWPDAEDDKVPPSKPRLQSSLRAAEFRRLIISDGKEPGDKVRRRYYLNSGSPKRSPPTEIVPENPSSKGRKTVSGGDTSKNGDTEIVRQSKRPDHPSRSDRSEIVPVVTPTPNGSTEPPSASGSESAISKLKGWSHE